MITREDRAGVALLRFEQGAVNALDLELLVEFESQLEMLAESIKYALIIVSSAPVLVLYPFLQRYFVKGVMIGALKG